MMRVLHILGGICWLVIAFGCGLFLWDYLSDGAGLQFFRVFSSLSILLGVVHVLGLGTIMVYSFIFALHFLAKGIVARPAK